MAASLIWVDALDALWAAIDQKSELHPDDGETPIFTKYKFETNADCLEQALPAYSDLNAISIWPTTITAEDRTYREKTFPVAFTVRIWTREWILKNALRTWMNVMDSIFQERDEGKYPDDTQANRINTYVKIATGRYPRLGSMQIIRQNFDEIQGNSGRATMTESVVICDTNKDVYPRAATA